MKEQVESYLTMMTTNSKTNKLMQKKEQSSLLKNLRNIKMSPVTLHKIQPQIELELSMPVQRKKDLRIGITKTTPKIFFYS